MAHTAAATEARMQAQIGDRIVIEGAKVGQGRHTGEVVEVIAGTSGEHYRVRWADGHETIFFPGSDAHVEPGRKRKSRR